MSEGNMYYFPTIVIDDFFKEPLNIRDYALSMEYRSSSNFSGVRTANLFEVNRFFAKNVCDKLLKSCGIPASRYTAGVFFHLTGAEYGAHGWPHEDYENYNGSIFASVTYLNPSSVGLDHGTSLFKQKKFEDTLNSIQKMRDSFATGVEDTRAKEEYTLNFEETVRVGGSFNRTIAYDSRRPHCGNGYFGETKEDKRLTMVIFFDEILTNLPKGHTPIQYAEMMSKI